MLDETIRRNGIGGSEAGAALGLNPFVSPYMLYLRKLDLLPAQPPTIRMILGKYLEAPTLALYSHVTGRDLEYQGGEVTRVHPNESWILGTFDAVVKGESRGVDAKVIAPDQAYQFGETADEIPEHIQI